MFTFSRFKVKAIGFAAAFAFSASAGATGIPVVDAAHIALQTVSWASQIAKMVTELKQTEAIWKSLTSQNQMGSLLADDLLRQFLPQDYWTVAEAIRTGKGDWNGAKALVDAIAQTYQYKTCAQLNTDPVLLQTCQREWRDIAMTKYFGDLAFKKAADNIANLQTYVSSINSSTDQKTISEIAARINLETVRMQNEHMKLETMARMEAAEVKLQTARVNNAVLSSLANFTRPEF